jgi:ribonuclease-3
MAEAAKRGAGLDWKTSLQELTAGLGLGVPEYRIDEAGPDHAKTFTAWAVVAGERYGGSAGRSKKEAEQRAAEAAWRELSARAERETAQAIAQDAAEPGTAAEAGREAVEAVDTAEAATAAGGIVAGEPTGPDPEA